MYHWRQIFLLTQRQGPVTTNQTYELGVTCEFNYYESNLKPHTELLISPEAEDRQLGSFYYYVLYSRVGVGLTNQEREGWVFIINLHVFYLYTYN